MRLILLNGNKKLINFNKLKMYIQDKIFYKLIKIDYAASFLFLFWTISIFSFLSITSIPLTYLSILLFIFNMALVIKKANFFYKVIPYIIILSPIFGSINFLGLNMLFSDFFLFSYFILFISKNKNIYHTKSFYFFFILIILFTLTHYFFGDLEILKPIISITELFILYSITKHNFILTSIDSFFFSILSAVLIGTILMFLAFYKGINLVEFNGNNVNVVLNSTNDFDMTRFKLNYFYTNFSVMIGCAIFISNYFIVSLKNNIHKTILFIIMTYLLVSLIASGSKTTLFISIFIFILSNLIFNFKKVFNVKNILFFTLFSMIVYYLLNLFLFNDVNKDLFIQRMQSNDSLIDRFGVYRNALNLLLNNPHRIIIGYGPDFLTNAGDLKVSNLYKINYYTKDEQGALDSGLITFFIEFGLLMFSFIAYHFFKNIFSLYKKINTINLTILQLVFTFIFSGFTQLIGISKISWFLIIFISISKVAVNNYRKNLI